MAGEIVTETEPTLSIATLPLIALASCHGRSTQKPRVSIDT